MKQYLAVLKKYAVFKGRASRREYWNYALFNSIFTVLFAAIDGAIMLVSGKMGFASVFFALAVTVPGLAVTSRRLHDVDKSFWFILINLIPLIGTIWFFILTIKVGNPEENQYSADVGQNNDVLPSEEAQHFEAPVVAQGEFSVPTIPAPVLTPTPIETPVAIPVAPEVNQTPLPAMLTNQSVVNATQGVPRQANLSPQQPMASMNAVSQQSPVETLAQAPVAVSAPQELPPLNLENKLPQV